MRSSVNGIFAKKIEGSSAEFDIHGEIGWDVWFSRMKWLVEGLDSDIDTVTFNIYSPGGDVWDGNAIVNLIGNMKQHTVANVQLAASMATIIALACDEVKMSANGRWLIHNPWTIAVGDAAEFEKRAAELRDTEVEAADYYYARSKGKSDKSRDDIVALMNEERWMMADEAKEWGFVDEVVDVFNVRQSAAFGKIAACAKIPLPDDFMKQITNEEKTMTEETETPETPEAETPEEIPETPETPEAPETDAPEESAEVKALRAEVSAKYADQIVALKADLKVRDEKIEQLNASIETLQSEKTSLDETVNKLQSRVDKFMVNGLSPEGDVADWPAAMKACDNDYEKARKKYPELYEKFMEQAR